MFSKGNYDPNSRGKHQKIGGVHTTFSQEVGRCERVLHFMGREVKGRQELRMQAVKWVVVKLQGDETASVFQRSLTLVLLQKYRDANGSRIMIQTGGVYTTFCQEEGILVHKFCNRNGRCIAILSQSIKVGGRFDSPDKWVVAKLQEDETASLCRNMSSRKVTRSQISIQSSNELYDPWISGPVYPGIVPKLSRHFLEISWEFCLYVSFFFPEKNATHKEF